MNGLLIYTIAGSEGSFGGLIKQADSENFPKILSSALLKARDCSSTTLKGFAFVWEISNVKPKPEKTKS